MRPSAGPVAGREFTWTAAQYCADIAKAAERLQDITGKKPLPLFRAPGGKTSPSSWPAARGLRLRACRLGAGGFLGDELPSENVQQRRAAAAGAARHPQPGDILLAHLGIWSRKDPWAPAVLEPLIVGLKAKGFCFATLREHPAYRDWIAKPQRSSHGLADRSLRAARSSGCSRPPCSRVMFAIGLGDLLEDAFDATGWLLVGLIQIAVLLAVIGPLQRWRPVEPVATARHPHRHPLHADPPAGPVPPGDVLRASIRCSTSCSAPARGRLGHVHLDQLWPGVTDLPWVAF